MGRTVKRLTDLEIDEVSLVNRPANQHGLVAIAKSHQEDSMSVYDANGDEVFEEELRHGDRVYDDTGTEFVFVEEDQEPETEVIEERELEMSKGFVDTATGAAKKTGEFARRAGRNVKASPGTAAAVAGTGAAVGGAGVYAVKKSLGTQVLEELSKALNDSDRDMVFAKAADRFDEIAQRNEQLEEMVVGLYNDRDSEGFTELAKGYELPIDPAEIGGLMFRASQVLPEEDVAALDRLFSSFGEISKAAFTEIGFNGGMESDVLGQIFAIAGDAISKSDSHLSQEQAVTALFSANPGAYDEYEAEQRRR